MEKTATMPLSKLAQSLKGKLLIPGDNGYDEARKIWNAMIDRKPAAIAQCENTDDVVKSVNFARDNNLVLAVKGGGHNVAGNAMCDRGLVVDLSKMRSVSVSLPDNKIRAEGGCLLSDVDKETQKFGLAVPAGIISHTGVAGLTLGGGFGWTSRKYGFSIDNLLSVEMVLANGTVVTASENENPDLFWAIRGGGGNFGIVTSFQFRGVKVGPEVYSGIIVQPFENAKKYLQFHRDFVRSMPDEMTVWMVIRYAPPLPFLPENIHGKLVVIVPFLYLGDAKQGEALIKPLREFGRKAGEHVGMNPFVGWQTGFDALNSHGARNYWKSHNLTGLPDVYIDTVITAAQNFPSPHCEIFIPHFEGAPSRVDEDATAYAYRKEPFNMNVHTRWTDAADDKKCIAWARDLYEKTKLFANGVYVNFLSEGEDARVKEAYSEKGWRKLVQIKTKYDPDNLFRMNQNIKPLNA